MRIFAQQLKTRLAALWGHLPWAARLVWQAAPGWTIGWGALLLVQGLLPVATVYLTRELVDSVVAARDGGGSWAAARPAILIAIAMATVLLLGELIAGLMRWVRTAKLGRVQDSISDRIHQQATAVDVAFYETPLYYDRLHRAVHDARSRPVSLLENLGLLAQNGITLLAMTAVLIPFGLWIPAVLLLSTLPALFVVAQYAWREHQWRLSVTEQQRRTRYYDYLLTGRSSAAELRLFDLGQTYRDAFQAVRSKLRGQQEKLAWDHALAASAASASGLVVTAAVAAWGLLRALRGAMSLGELAFFFQAFYQGQRMMRSLLSTAGEVYADALFLENLSEFLSLEPQLVAPRDAEPPPARLERGIELVDVTFRYPGTERSALTDFNLAIPAGQMVALVGANGAGKSTLIKLLCRFYDPDKGAILLEGRDLRSFDPKLLRRMVTVLFQEPIHFSETAARNIELGDLAANPQRETVVAAARAAGADAPVERLPKGYETMLGHWFSDAAELSVGEWQRVALARAFLRQAPIILLDEPTSAMDPWAEEDWLRRLRQCAADRTVLLITHRLTTARFADVIHVMDAGHVVESGGHDELLARGGRYAESWGARARVGEPRA